MAFIPRAFDASFMTTRTNHDVVSSLPLPVLHAKKKQGGKSGNSSGRSGSGKGFGANNEKSYDTSATKAVSDLIDTEAAMNSFFSSNEEWNPLFRSIAAGPKVPAMDILGGTHGEEIQYDSNTLWKQLSEIPEDESEKALVATFLDAMQQSLLDIPVNEIVKEDENDMHFLEEGRRMLAVSRFQVLPGLSGGSVEQHDALFQVCWSELHHLRTADVPSTGSLILLPDYDMTNLRQFTDMNLQRPLDWLGHSTTFEVASMVRDIPAIRMLHRLEDMPTEPYSEQ